MNQGTYPLAAAMVNEINRVDVISNNLANVNTNGFKQESLTEGSFNHYLKRAEQEGFAPSKLSTVMNTVPKIDGKFLNQEKGPIVATGNSLDFALKQRDTFFRVQDDSGEVVYSRDGAFKPLNGMLVNSSGQFILNNDNEAISVEDEDYIQQISVVQIDYNDLEKYKDNNFKEKEAGAFVQNIDDNSGYLIQGSIEKSNVNTVRSMVNLIDAHRGLERAQKGITSIGEINAKLIEKIGSNTK
ncbi:MAG: flagellar hook-basal body protein [Halarcobacter sp.]